MVLTVRWFSPGGATPRVGFLWCSPSVPISLGGAGGLDLLRASAHLLQLLLLLFLQLLFEVLLLVLLLIGAARRPALPMVPRNRLCVCVNVLCVSLCVCLGMPRAVRSPCPLPPLSPPPILPSSPSPLCPYAMREVQREV